MLLSMLAALVAPGAAAGADHPGALRPRPPLSGGVDSFDDELVIGLAQGHPILQRADLRLRLSFSLPAGAVLLRYRELALSSATSENGEILPLLIRPRERAGRCQLESPANHEQALRLEVGVCPPAATTTRLGGIHGRWEFTLASGAPSAIEIPDRVGATAPCDGSSITVIGRTGTIQVVVPRKLAERFARAVGMDAGGRELASHSTILHPELLDLETPPEAVTVNLTCPVERCAMVRLEWYPASETKSVELDIPAVEIPGGIQGVDGMPEDAVPWHANTAPTPADAVNAAVEHGDAAALAALVATRAPEDVVERDGWWPLARAVIHHRADLVSMLAKAHATVGYVGRNQGFNALELAVLANDAPCLGALLAAGADPAAAGTDLRSSLDLARDLGRWRMMRLLARALH
jgi:hypothetical protein